MEHKSERSKICTLLLAAAFWFAPVSHASSVILEDDHTIHLLTDAEVRGIVRDVRKRGFTCDTVSSAYYRTEKNILLECNKRKYAFAIKDYGGKRLVFVDSILHQERDSCGLCDSLVGLKIGTRELPRVMVAVKSYSEYPYHVLQIDEYGGTPLAYAVETDNVEIIRILLEAGAIASMINKRGCTTKEGQRIINGGVSDTVWDMLSEATAQYAGGECK